MNESNTKILYTSDYGMFRFLHGKHSLTIEPQTSCKEYLHHIEELYNYKNSIRQILF